MQDEVLSGTQVGLYDFGARLLDGQHIPAWTSIDPLAEKYYNVSPYVYAANNPILYVDRDGREITFSYEWEKDKKGNYVINKQGGYNLTGVTMHVTGKVINVSSNLGVNMNAAAQRISNQISSTFSGTIGNGVTFSTNINLSVAGSMSDIEANDHVFALADITNSDVSGAANQFGGKVAFIDADYFTGWYDTTIGNTGPWTAAHEFGHLANLYHTTTRGNLMKSGGTRSNLTDGQLRSIYNSYEKGLLNQGSNYELEVSYSTGKTVTRRLPNRGLVHPFIKYK